MRVKTFALLSLLLFSTAGQAVTDDELMRLEADMLEYMSSSERDTFFIISEQLKQASLKADNEKLFYKAWSKQAIFEAAHQNYAKADEIASALSAHALEKENPLGKYYALHTQGTIQMDKGEYVAAEQAFLKALDIHHRYLPEVSAAEDLRELMKIAYLRNDVEKAKHYASQLLAEPNLAPHHKGRILYRLSVMAFDENNAQEFNRIYDEMKRLMQADGIRTNSLFTEVNYHIINGDYRQALRLADWLSPDTCAERKALIYHRMGDNEKAYEYMVLYKHLSDSIDHSSHNSTVANLYLRMNNDRLRLEQEVLKNQNSRLLNRLYIFIGVVLLGILMFFIFKWRSVVRLLKNDQLKMDYEKKDAERALEDLNELSFYESQDELELTSPLRPNELCNHLTTSTQLHCYKGVSTLFLTNLPNDMEIKTNPDALRMLLKHLLDYSARFTREGTIKLSCTDAGENVLFSVTDTSPGLSGNKKNRFIGMFSTNHNKIRYIGMNFNICQSITRLLQGRIWHDVSYTKGTRFCVELPKEPQASK